MKKSALFALIFAYLAFVASAYISDAVFERLPHLEDEMAYTYQARMFAQGDVVMDTPLPRRAFWQPFVIDCDHAFEKYQQLNCDGKRFSKYPPGWPMLLALGYLVEMPWIVNAFIALLTVAVTYRLAREIFSESAGMVAAVLMFASPIVLLQNGTLMGHPAGLFFTTTFFYGMWRLEKGQRLRNLLLWGVLAGVSLGMVVAIRPLTGLALALPLAAYSGLRIGFVGWRAVWQRWGSRWWQRQGRELPFLGDYEWLLRWGILLAPLMAIGGIALWVANEMEEYWPRWPIWVIAGALIIATVYFVLQSGEVRRVNPRWPRRWQPTLLPLLMVAFSGMATGALFPAYNYVTTGDPTQNLYELVWEYDKVGFGEEYGRTGHTWEKARRTMKWDMECYSRDLFGWVYQPDNPPQTPQPRNDCMKPDAETGGLSWLLLPFGLVLGWRRRWTWLLFGAAVLIIGSNLWYWIGAGIYSARYFYEATSALVILSAVGVAGLADMARSIRLDKAVYAVLLVLVGFSLVGYAPDRIDGLYRYGRIGRHQLETVDALRLDPDRPVLVVSIGPRPATHWRDVGAVMALTSPSLDSEYILVRDPEEWSLRPETNFLADLIARFPEYQIVFYRAGEFSRGTAG